MLLCSENGSLESTHDCFKNPSKSSHVATVLYSNAHEINLTDLVSLSSQNMDPSGTRTAGSRLYNYGAKKPSTTEDFGASRSSKSWKNREPRDIEALKPSPKH